MAAVVLSLVVSVLIGGFIWLIFGSRFGLHEDPTRNYLLNLAIWIGIAWPFMLALIVLFLAPA